jgi:NAD(P)-dependent dehydrogenase (short-subunit alcohol dehydrogenase family)
MTTHQDVAQNSKVSLRGKTALVVGGTSGVGKATAAALLREGAIVTVMARRAEGLKALRAELGAELNTVEGDAAEPQEAERVMRELRPELLVLALGAPPPTKLLDELEWAEFSATWEVDVKASFWFVKGAMTQPLRPGSTVILVSSGAAIGGSPISGGYAGAKRMQWLLPSYAQKVSDRKQLGIRFLAVLPTQLIEGTNTAERASTVYGALSGITAEAFMKRYEARLTPDKVASAIVALATGGAAGAFAYAVKGTGFEPLP